MTTLGEDTNAYYQFHAKIYDLTRWTFLFGRRALVRDMAQLQPRRVLEVGCGTGTNLIALKRLLPGASCCGIDASADMLRVARRKSAGLEIDWIEGRYGSTAVDEALGSENPPDLIFFSYALSMFNPGYDSCLEKALGSLSSGGSVCVVDFHSSAYPWFRRWMAMNHVRMESQLLEAVKELGELRSYREQKGLLGIWRYNTMMSQARQE